MAILREYPRQVLILKGTRDVSALDARAPGITNRMIKRDETRHFETYCNMLGKAEQGQVGYVRQLLERGQWAREHMSKMLTNSADMGDSIAEFSAKFTTMELDRIRQRHPFTREMIGKLFGVVTGLAEAAFASHPHRPAWPHRTHRINHFIFRNALFAAVYMLHLVRQGTKVRKPEKARNDLVDLTFATYGSFFNGIMSMDMQLISIHGEGRHLIERLGGRLSEDYLATYAKSVVRTIPEGQ